MFIKALTNMALYGGVGNIKKTQTLKEPDTGFRFGKVLTCDTVSFTGKNYSGESIVNPTEHCAYCGTKVYDEQQIDGIAKEILASKSSRLEGKVKSVLEKLKTAKDAPELMIAKEIENKDHIEFFNGLLNASAKRPYTKGADLLKELHGLDEKEALETVKSHIHPLLSTIDHVSPQRLEQENKNVDSNLVEACYCCNHDIKNGIDFAEFYTIFPSIEYNMPQEKFMYASASLLDKKGSGIEARLSAASMIKQLNLLFVQRKEVQNTLASVNHKIKNSESSILDSIDSHNKDIEEKQQEILNLQQRLEERKQDPEFNAMLRRKELQSEVKNITGVISGLSESRQRLSNAINDIRFDKRGKKKQPAKKLSEEDTKKIEEHKRQIQHIESEITRHEEARTEREIEIDDLNIKFPPTEVYQQRKTEADSILSAHAALESEKEKLANATAQMENLTRTEKELKEKAAASHVKTFDISTYSGKDAKTYARYKDITEALDFIEKHQNGSVVKTIINNSAKVQLEAELEDILQEPVIRDLKANEEYESVQKELESLRERKTEVQKQISTSNKLIIRYNGVASQMSKEEAKKESEFCSENIRRINEKRLDLDIPQKIEALKANINLLESTIEQLRDKLTEIRKLV